MEKVRIRVKFGTKNILNKTQKTEELNKTWFLLNTNIYKTINELSSHITCTFNLKPSCPFGISLYMDGFVLPPFESTCILKDNDLIRVERKKRETSGEIVEVDGVNLIEGEDIGEKIPNDTDVLLLENGKLGNQTGSLQNEHGKRQVNVLEDLLPADQSTGEITGSRKRKTLKKLQNAKVKRKGKTSTGTAEAVIGIKLTDKEKTMEKQQLDTGVLCVANGLFDTETNAIHSEFPHKGDNLKEGSVLVEDSTIKDAASKNRKSSKEPESSKKKKRRAVIYQDTETDAQAENDKPCHNPKRLVIDRKKKKGSVGQEDTESYFHVQQNQPSEFSGLASEMNVDKTKKVSDKESKHERVLAPANADFVEPFPLPKGGSVSKENGTESVDVPNTSERTKKVSKSTLRTYAKRKWLKELKAEAKELIAEKVLIPQKHSPEREHQQHNQNGFVVRPGHIRFEPCENDQDVQQSKGIVDSFQSVGITSKTGNRKWGYEKIEYCTRSKCRDSSGEDPQVTTVENVNTQDDLTEFYKLPLLIRCPEEGDVIAYRVQEQSSDAGPILSSFRIGKTVRLDKWVNTLLLTPVDKIPTTSVKSDNAWEQQKDDSNEKESGNIEIDVALLYDVRIVRHSSIPGKKVDVWDSLSQAESVKTLLLSRKREWGKVVPDTTSSKQGWGGNLGPTQTLSKKEWGKVVPSTEQGWSKDGSKTTSWAKEGSNTSHVKASSKQGWGKEGLATTSWKKDWSNASPITSSWSKQECVSPATTSYKKEWGKEGSAKNSWKKGWTDASPTTSSWSSKPFNDAKQSTSCHVKSKW